MILFLFSSKHPLQSGQTKCPIVPVSEQVAGISAIQLPKACSVAGISVCATSTLLQTAQWLPSVKPALTQVGKTAGSMITVCSDIGIVRSAISLPSASKSLLQIRQCACAFVPVAEQVAGSSEIHSPKECVCASGGSSCGGSASYPVPDGVVFSKGSGSSAGVGSGSSVGVGSGSSVGTGSGSSVGTGSGSSVGTGSGSSAGTGSGSSACAGFWGSPGVGVP